MSLSTIFLRLQLLHQKVENTAFDPQTTPQLLDEACALVDSAWRRYDEDDIASRNETVEDVNTGSLKYAHFHSGMCVWCVHGDGD